MTELEVVIRTFPLIDKLMEGEQEAASLRGVEPIVVGPSVAPDDKVGIAVWVMCLPLTGFEINVVLKLEGDRVWAMVCADVCTFGVNGDVTVEKVLVTWVTKLTVSDPLVVLVL